MTLTYQIVFRPEPEGGYTVLVPSLPGCVTYGETIEEAGEMAKEAIQLYVEVQRENGEDIVDDAKTLEARVEIALV